MRRGEKQLTHDFLGPSALEAVEKLERFARCQRGKPHILGTAAKTGELLQPASIQS